MDTQTILSIINTLSIVGGGTFGLIQYSRQQRFKRVQNLFSIWEKFVGIEDNIKLFELFDRIEIEQGKDSESNAALRNYSQKTKLKFLALLEEVAIYSKESEVDKEYAKYLFQWHFKYVFIQQYTKELFWHNMGGVGEIDAPYWAKSKGFAGQLPNR